LHLQFKFVFMDVEEQPPECPFDGLILHDVKTGFTANPKNDQEITKYLGRTRYCGGSKFPNVVSKSRKVEAIFYADESSQERGFNVTWKAVPVQGGELLDGLGPCGPTAGLRAACGPPT